jgi:hypothetical protein
MVAGSSSRLSQAHRSSAVAAKPRKRATQPACRVLGLTPSLQGLQLAAVRLVAVPHQCFECSNTSPSPSPAQHKHRRAAKYVRNAYYSAQITKHMERGV